MATYRRFVREVLVPLLGEDVVFQAPPTLRVHTPGPRPMGKPHRDRDYAGHCGDEINFWLPLTRARGANSLFVESAPGRRDHRALDLRYGQCHRFDGENCEHYAVANDTGATRVSLDFRVIPASRFRDEFGGRIGSYPCESTAAN